ncbi:alpha/beta fold hydrolase [Oceanicola sp. S124]|uniref:alpha/beta fold hydrolase n=1 Tax=Oceanicola sp. S124 TaxID=1042378 RepID=UPI000255A97E|nr:alpha/beta fold hydrolase [Oceanicola sp. S124]
MTIVLGLLGLLLAFFLGLALYAYIWKRRAEAAVPPRGAFTRISTGRLHYLDVGQGPAILLIHGLGGQLGNFDCGLIDDLARDHRVIAIDRPGMGWSERPLTHPCAPADNARLMFEIMDKLGIEQPLVVGHSLGGAIALAMAVQDAERLRGLALLAPLTLRGQEPAEIFDGLAIRSDLQRFLTAWTFATPAALRYGEKVIETLYAPEQMPPNAATQGGAMLTLVPRHFYHTSRDFMHAADGLEQMARKYADLTVPVRLLYGTGDRILDPQHHGAKLVGRHPQMGLRTVPGGHMLPLTQPGLCAEFIRDASAKMRGSLTVRRASPEVYR